MSRNIIIPTVLSLIILSLLFLLQYYEAEQQLVLMESNHATIVAKFKAKATTQIKAQTTIQAQIEKAVNEDRVQATRQAEIEVTLQAVEENYQIALSHQLGAQAQLRLEDTIDPTLGTLLAIESMRQYHTIEGDVAIRRGIELMSWQPVFTMTERGCVHNISLNKNGERLAISNSTNGGCTYESNMEARVWNINNNQEILRLPPVRMIKQIDLSPDGSWLLINESRYVEDVVGVAIKVIEIDTSQQITEVVSLDSAFNPNNLQLAFISGNNDTVSILDISTQQVITELIHTKTISGVEFSPDGRWIAAYDENEINFWDTGNNKLVYKIPHVYRPEYGSTVHFSPDSRLVAISERYTTVVHIWDMESWQETTQIEGSYPVEFSSDGRWLATEHDGYVYIWDTSDGRELTRLTTNTNDIAFSPDGKWLATTIGGRTEGKTKIWETNRQGWEWREVARMPVRNFILKFSTDSKLLISSGDDIDRAKVWKLQPGLEISLTNVDKPPLTTVPKVTIKIAENDAGTIEILGNQKVIRMVCGEDTVTNIIEFKESAFSLNDNNIALSTDNKLLAIGGNELERDYLLVVRVWDISTCHEKYQLPYSYYYFNKVVFSPNNQLLAVGAMQPSASFPLFSEIKLWDVATGSELVSINNLGSENLSFSSDSRWLLATGSSGGVRIFEAATGREIAHLSNEDYPVVFSADDRYVVATGNHSMAWMWQPADLIDLACGRVSRNLTKKEWQQYLGNEPYRATCPDLPVQDD